MDTIAGPSNADSSVFTTQPVSGRDPSYYSNLEPDFQWIKSSVKYLIYLVSVHFDEFYDKTLKKKVLWKKIAEEMRTAGFNCNSDDCDKKWRNIKKSYISVLQKQVKGDFSSKFTYFDQMHAFLGKEIDPLGMREQGLNKAIQERTLEDGGEFPRIPFYEVTEDDNFEWNEPAVRLLLDLILEHKEIFKINSDIDSVWESISDKMNSEGGYSVIPEQCQRKWVNLSEGFRHYQGEAEASGVHPKWSYFSLVRHVINTLNVPVTLVQNSKPNLTSLKVSLSTPTVVKELPRKRKRRRESIQRKYDSKKDDDKVPRDFDSALEYLERSLNVDERLSHLEGRIESAQRQKAVAKHSNNILGLILNELKRINKSFEEKKNERRKEEAQAVAMASAAEVAQAEVQVQRNLKQDSLQLIHHEEEEEDPPIVDEAACRQAILNMQTMQQNLNFQFVKAPKVELVEGPENEGIIIVEGL